MRHRSSVLLLVLSLAAASPLSAQKGLIDLTTDLLNRFLNGASTEKVALTKVDSQVAVIDAKIKSFNDCKSAFETAAGMTSSQTLGLTARIAMKAKCGATSDDDLLKEKQKILDGPANDAAQAAKMKLADYLNLKNKITGYLSGDRSAFTPSGLDLLASRASDLSSTLGVSVAQAAPSGGGGGMGGAPGMAMPGMWSVDFAWAYIGQLFALEYASGATMFEKPYEPGQWTRWQITASDKDAGNETIERAFLGKTADGGEWWRTKTIFTTKQDGKDVVDTVVLEALYKPVSDQVKQIVRMRGKLPGSKDPQELMVPAGLGMINTAGMFPMKPTPESIDGATVGTETITSPAGTFSARHVRFGAGTGSIDWWLADNVPGGWVKFTGSGADKKDSYVMELIGQGTGATSELGIKM